MPKLSILIPARLFFTMNYGIIHIWSILSRRGMSEKKEDLWRRSTKTKKMVAGSGREQKTMLDMGFSTLRVKHNVPIEFFIHTLRNLYQLERIVKTFVLTTFVETLRVVTQNISVLSQVARIVLSTEQVSLRRTRGRLTVSMDTYSKLLEVVRGEIAQLATLLLKKDVCKEIIVNTGLQKDALM